jgi:vacuolar-type H+-ATPase subunit H
MQLQDHSGYSLSGVDTIKIIVNAEKEAARMLAESQNKALEIRKRRDTLIEEQRQQILQAASKEAEAMLQNAENQATVEAQKFESDAENRIQQVVSHASTKKGAAVEKLVSLIMEIKPDV